VIGTASTANVGRVSGLGADEVIDHTQTRFEDTVEPVDVVFDTVGGDTLRRSFAVVRAGGRIVSVAEPARRSGPGSAGSALSILWWSPIASNWSNSHAWQIMTTCGL